MSPASVAGLFSLYLDDCPAYILNVSHVVISSGTLHRLLGYTIAAVWLTNGLCCKVLNLVPRHEQIVARILGDQHAPILTKAIGFSEVLMAIWIMSRVRSRLCAVTQIGLVVVMNSIEFVLAPDLLLFGRLNALNALLFVGVVYYNEFVLTPHAIQQNR